MPTYEYECGRCRNRFDLFQKITDPPRRTCPRCGGRLARLVSGGLGVIYKGSGFYVTDSRSSAPRAEKAGKADGDAKKEKTEKKKEAKASSGD